MVILGHMIFAWPTSFQIKRVKNLWNEESDENISWSVRVIQKQNKTKKEKKQSK